MIQTNSLFFKLIAESGAEYSPTSILIADDKFLTFEGINPGLAKTGNVVFEVPIGLTGLAMHGQMTSVLKGITSSLHLTLSAMEDLQNSTDKTFDKKKVNAARSAIQQTEAAMKMLPPPIENAAEEQRKLNNRLNEGAQNAGAFVKQIVGIATAYLSLRKVKDIFSDLISIGLEFKSHMQSSQFTFTFNTTDYLC